MQLKTISLGHSVHNQLFQDTLYNGCSTYLSICSGSMVSNSMRSGLNLCTMAQNANPFFQDDDMSLILTLGYPSVTRLAHTSRAFAPFTAIVSKVSSEITQNCCWNKSTKCSLQLDLGKTVVHNWADLTVLVFRVDSCQRNVKLFEMGSSSLGFQSISWWMTTFSNWPHAGYRSLWSHWRPGPGPGHSPNTGWSSTEVGCHNYLW